MNLSLRLLSLGLVGLLFSVSAQAASYSAAPQQRHHSHYKQPAHEQSNRALLRYAPQYNQRQPDRYHKRGHQRGNNGYHHGYQQGYRQGYRQGQHSYMRPQHSGNVIIIQRNR